jgi:uncharacterized membrane protein YgdD (TMEM256/DUF423 family)
MPKAARLFIVIGAVCLMFAAQLSAYGFHGLEGKVPPAKIRSWEWAVQMQVYHALGLIVVGLFLRHIPDSRLLRGAGGLMMLGMVLFSGSIYAEVLGAPPAIGEVAPLGGSSFMLAWLLTAIAAWRARP